MICWSSNEESGGISNALIEGFELRNNIGAMSIRPDQGSGNWNVEPFCDRIIF